MASNPPFHVEDQTDEDFFDKLVDDDFGPNESSSSTVPKFTEGNESDDARAFANLSIEDSGGGDLLHEMKTGDITVDASATKPVAGEESDSSLMAGKGLGSDSSMIESNNMVGSEEAMSVSDSERVSKSSAGSGVKEVGWNYFHPDLSENGGHGFGSYSDFFSDLGENSVDFPASRDFSGKVEENVNSGANIVSGNGDNGPVGFDNSVNYGQYQDGQVYGNPVDQSVNGQDLSSSQYWENLYPGWKYDPNTGQWYQVDGFNANTNTLGTYDNSTADWSGASDGKSEISYLRQSAQSVMGTVADTSTTENVSNWSQVSQVNNGYPEHMIFDPQYPGWYYDTIAQEWRTLESYNATSESTVQTQDQHNQNGHASMVAYHNNNNSSIYGEYGQTDKHSSQALGNQGQYSNWAESYSSYNQPDLNIWQPKTDAKTETVTETATLSNFGGNQKVDNLYGSKDSMNSNVDREKSFSSVETVQSYEKAGKDHVEANGTAGIQSFIHGGNFSQQFNMGDLKQSEQMNFSNDFYGPHKPVNMAHQSFQRGQQFSYAPNVGRSSAGRPPHALVTFGFGGKLIVMKDNSSVQNSSFGSQDPVGSSISVLNLMEVVTGNSNASSTGGSSFDYFRALCQQSFPGPLVGGNVGSKELNKWIDERIANCESPDLDYRKGKRLSLLLSLLKIACQHYGKLRSPFGTDTTMRESDTPESAVAKLFASAKKDGSQYGAYGALSHCLQQLPSEGQIRATASEVQSLLVSGRKMDALQCAQEGQLWGPALVLASQLGDQFYIDTVKQMALRQLVAGSPLRTLCLLIAGQPAEVFSADNTTDSNLSGPVIMSQQPAQLQIGANGMLNDWEENLAVITANRTKDDELVIIHLGDCLWRERSEITAAHICYLVAEANFEAYSDSARLCLIGADHWKFPRTYASPEAIQRTELYEYSKVLGNSQFILQPFQPYKLIYAYMLAEVGKVSDALKYCQAVLKSLKTGRAPEVETWKQLVLSLEERIRTHQQGGYATNLAPGKLVGKLLNFFDSTAHRVVGGLPPPAPSTSHGNVQVTEHYHQQMAPRVSASQSTMTMSSLMPSASMEPISDWAADGNKMTMHNRSVSEPDFGRSPRQVDSSKEETSSSAQGKPAGSGTASRFGRFGFGSQLLQKTVGLVLRPRSDRQAKLGEKNKFYYDEKLKRWVEEGVEPPAEEAALAPPPTTSAFQNGMSDYNSKPAVKSEGSPPGGSPKFKSPSTSEHSSGIPPIPSNSNQFSARGRMGVRARYVDTFNQGRGNMAKSFQSPSVPSVRPAVAANAKFFVPAPAPPGDQGMEAIAESAQEENAINENHLTSIADDLSQTSTSSSVTMQRVPSMDNITRKAVVTNGIGPHSAHSRRTASWSGSFNDAFSPPKITEPKPLGEVVGMSPFMPSPMSSSSFGDELHEVEL